MLKKKLEDSLKETQQYKENASKHIHNLRGSSFFLLGWRIDMKPNENRTGHTISLISKLKNAENSPEVFTFTKLKSEQSNYELVASPSTEKMDKEVMENLLEEGGFPALLAHVQINLLKEQSKRNS